MDANLIAKLGVDAGVEGVAVGTAPGVVDGCAAVCAPDNAGGHEVSFDGWLLAAFAVQRVQTPRARAEIMCSGIRSPQPQWTGCRFYRGWRPYPSRCPGYPSDLGF